MGAGWGVWGGIKGERLLKGSSKKIQARNSTRGVGWGGETWANSRRTLKPEDWSVREREKDEDNTHDSGLSNWKDDAVIN